MYASLIEQVEEFVETIHSEEIRKFTYRALEVLPNECFLRPSSYNHHNEEERHEFGNLIHSKKVTINCFHLIEIEEDVTSDDIGYITSAAILHDVGKYGLDGKTTIIQYNHPSLVRPMLSSIAESSIKSTVISIILSHMGKWGLRYKLPPVDNRNKYILHAADYMATRD